MEILAKATPWLGVLNLCFATIWLIPTTFMFRKVWGLNRAIHEVRPPLSDDKVAVLRPGDTVLMMLPLDGMTADQQAALIDSTRAMAGPAKERGIEFIVVPDWEQKAIVMPLEYGGAPPP